jgi:hypothetical protein
VLAANADPETLLRYDKDLDNAFEDAWRDPSAQREFLALVERYQREGPPPREERVTRQQIRARYGV